MPTSLQIFPSILPRPRLIPQRRRQAWAAAPPSAAPRVRALQACAQRDDSSSPAPGLAQNQRRRDHVTLHARGRHLTLQGNSRTGRFHRTRGPHPAASRSSFRTSRRTAVGSVVNCHVTGFGSFPISMATKKSFLCASIPAYVVTCFRRPAPIDAALAPRGVNPRFRRYRPPLSSATALRRSMAGRSFHIV
jgi:hypothetical protein